MKTRKVRPFGYLYTNSDGMWYLLSPQPIENDSWQRDNERRFVVVPVGALDEIQSYARHLVSNDFTIEYRVNLPEIEIEVLGDDDLINLDLADAEVIND